MRLGKEKTLRAGEAREMEIGSCQALRLIDIRCWLLHSIPLPSLSLHPRPCWVGASPLRTLAIGTLKAPKEFTVYLNLMRTWSYLQFSITLISDGNFALVFHFYYSRIAYIVCLAWLSSGFSLVSMRDLSKSLRVAYAISHKRNENLPRNTKSSFLTD